MAAAVAFDRLFDLKIEKVKLVEYAAEGEIVSAGTKHYDNVSGSLLGGFVIVRTSPRLEFIRLDAPKDLVLTIAIPLIEVPDKKTQIARGVLPNDVSLKSVVHNVSNASTIVAGFLLKDVEMIATHQTVGEMAPYERLLGDALRGDQTLFAREDEIEAQCPCCHNQRSRSLHHIIFEK